MNSHSANKARERLVDNLSSTEFFNNYSSAFAQLTGLTLTLDATREGEVLTGAQTTYSLAGVADTRVPVRVGKALVAAIHTGGVRIEPATAQAFAPVAAALLDSGCSAAEVKAESIAFSQLPVMPKERYEAALAMLKSFAFQLGESAHRLLFAHAQHEPEAVRTAKAFIMEHLAEPMSLEQVAAHAHVSPFHFCKVFKRATGMTFTDFVNRVRVEKARKMLMRPEARITEVAYDVGFQSLSHFNRSFRRIAGESPTEFRSRLRSPRGMTLAAA
jgi:hypothetical protein